MSFSCKCIAIIGASSFIGRHLVDALSRFEYVDMRLMTHVKPLRDSAGLKKAEIVTGDLLNPETLNGFLVSGCTVINLVNLTGPAEKDSHAAITNLAMACRTSGVKRLVHCSTAVIAGNIPDDIITEETLCRPLTDYEISKYKAESLLRKLSAGHFELAILRPTAVFGKDGKNLLKLADELVRDSRLLNYIKSCIHDRRRMNLVSIENVTAALLFLADADRLMQGEVFILSEDDDPMNNYRDIEKFLMNRLGCSDYKFPRFVAPGWILRVLLSLAGRSNSNSGRIYSSGKIFSAGFKKAVSFKDGLESFAEWYSQSNQSIKSADRRA